MTKKPKKTWKMWGLFWTDGTLVKVAHTKKEASPEFKHAFTDIKVKRVTVIEGDLNDPRNQSIH